MPDQDSVFIALRRVLSTHVSGLRISADTPGYFCLEAEAGPATLAAWGGELRRKSIPVAWVKRSKSHVSYHLMALAGNTRLLERLSPALKARLHGKTCFNVRTSDLELLPEINLVTASAISAFRRAGFITD